MESDKEKKSRLRENMKIAVPAGEVFIEYINKILDLDEWAEENRDELRKDKEMANLMDRLDGIANGMDL